MKISTLSTHPDIRFDADQDCAVISRLTTRHQEKVVLFVADDRTLWLSIERGCRYDAAPLQDATISDLISEAKARYTVGLIQPHLARIALEWVRQGKINIHRLSEQTLERAARIA